MSTTDTSELADTLRRIGDTAFAPAAVGRLATESDAITARLGEIVVAEIPAFSESNNPRILPELAEHGRQHTTELVRLLRERTVGDFAFVRAHAKRRAEQHFPLEATLHAYRCGHRVFSRWVREAALADVASPAAAQAIVAALADFTIEYTDTISTIAAGAYLSQIRLLADVAGDRRARLLNVLLEGYDESDRRVTKILRDAGYLDQRQAFCVALAQPVDAAEMSNPDRARRLADALDGILRKLPVRRLIDLRDSRVTLVLSHARRMSGWTEAQSDLARRVATALSLAGNAVLIGVSNDVPSTAQIPAAFREAALALELASVTRRVVQIAQVPARQLMLHLSGAAFQRALPAWTGDFFAANDRARGALVATARAYAAADMNVLKAAQRLSVHPNTVYTRLQKVLDITGIQARSFDGLSELLLIIDCVQRESDATVA